MVGETPNLTSDLNIRSSDTVASPASIFATRDWLDFNSFAAPTCVRCWRSRWSRSVWRRYSVVLAMRSWSGATPFLVDAMKRRTTSTAPSKTYSTAGTYTVTIVGPVGGLNFGGSAAITELMSVERWGNVAFTTMAQAFHNATNLTVNATDTPDLKNVASMQFMFLSTPNLKGNF